MSHAGAPPEHRVVAAALHYAALGWPVVPLHTPHGEGRCSCGQGAACDHAGKHPRYHPDDLPHGLHSATTDAGQLQRWWRRWPTANVGIATGQASGLLVIDRDGPAGVTLPPTATVITGRGLHAYFVHPLTPLRSRIGVLPGLDIRADQALVVAPPSRHASGWRYCWQHWQPLAPVPAWLLPQVRPAPPPPPAPQRSHGPAYAQAVLTGELARLAAARPGTRNTTLNGVAFRCGQFVGRGNLDQREVAHLLTLTALQLGLSPREVAATLRSGLTAGQRTALP